MSGEKKPASPGVLGKPGGLYDSVHMTRRQADLLALGAIALLALVLALVLLFGRGGFTVAFDPNGGTDVAPCQVQYGEEVPMPEDPSREGYAFTGWYIDDGCTEPWDPMGPVTDNLTLYAGWEKTA